MQVRGCNEGASASQYYTPDGLYRIDGTEMGREDFRARTPPRMRLRTACGRKPAVVAVGIGRACQEAARLVNTCL